jgi:DNA-binding response OmpR family regulator
MRILIIEDDDRIAKPLAEYLRRQHHIVDITTDRLEGWKWSQSELYELILLDLMLPKLDGITLCQRLRAASSNALILRYYRLICSPCVNTWSLYPIHNSKTEKTKCS